MTSLELFKYRGQLKSLIRRFFQDRDYLEIDTPVLVPCPGTEIHLGFFKTNWEDHQGKAHPLYLRTSPELHMKQAVAKGASRIFQFAKSFRNQGEISAWHHPEFTMLEWYQTEVQFLDFIKETIELLQQTTEGFRKYLQDTFHRSLPFSLPSKFSYLSAKEAFSKYLGIDLVDNDPDLAQKLKPKVLSLTGNEDFETAFFKTMIEKIEPILEQLGFVVFLDYPPSQAALAKVENNVAKRFEIYINRVELCNGFLELPGAKENRDRIQGFFRQRKALGKEVPGEDHDFYLALENGLPQTCGNALGFDRFLALLLGEKYLDNVIPFRDNAPWNKNK